jgi:UDPglucose 6-dehydrogenase
MNITIVGTGYVGLSLALLLSSDHNILALDIDKKKVDSINNKVSPINDSEIIKYLKKDGNLLRATTDQVIAYKNADYVIISIPINFIDKINSFDTSSIKEVISNILSINKTAQIVIKSTIPIGFTEEVKKYFSTNNIFYSPEFLREGKALHDNLFPSRIIIGDTNDKAIKFGRILSEASLLKKEDISISYMSSSEAEAVKLFSNSYLAMRVGFFNELDSFAETNKLSSKNIIQGMSTDPRIGNYYNNPSFGYGGYCLPKDTQQLLSNYSEIPNEIISAIIKSNEIRKDFIVNSILAKGPKIIGVYRLIMKKGSDNFRESSIIDIMDKLINVPDIEIIIYEPLLKVNNFEGCEIEREISNFKKKSDLIITNRFSNELDDVHNKVYTRDIFNNN